MFEQTVGEYCDVVVRGHDTPELFYSGYVPDQELKDQLAILFNQLLEFAPSSSALRARIELIEGGFKAYLLLTHEEGSMYAVEHATRPHKAVQRALDTIYTKVRKWRKERKFDQSAAKAVEAQPDWAFHPRVLIVDDDPVSTKLIESCLIQQGCETYRVENGQEAVREVITQDFDLVVMDWQMPEMNGGETLATAQDALSFDSTLRIPWVTSHLPVVMYSGENQERIEVPECDNFEVLGYIPKSSTYTELKTLTAEIIDRLKAAA